VSDRPGINTPTFLAGDRVWYIPDGWPAHDGIDAVVVKNSYWMWTTARRGFLEAVERVRLTWTEEFLAESHKRSATVDVWHVRLVERS
jgi:hypothetical protein